MYCVLRWALKSSVVNPAQGSDIRAVLLAGGEAWNNMVGWSFWKQHEADRAEVVDGATEKSENSKTEESRLGKALRTHPRR